MLSLFEILWLETLWPETFWLETFWLIMSLLETLWPDTFCPETFWGGFMSEGSKCPKWAEAVGAEVVVAEDLVS